MIFDRMKFASKNVLHRDIIFPATVNKISIFQEQLKKS